MGLIDENSPTGEGLPLSKIVESLDLSKLSPNQREWVMAVIRKYAEASPFEDEGGPQALVQPDSYEDLTPCKSIVEIIAMYQNHEG